MSSDTTVGIHRSDSWWSLLRSFRCKPRSMKAQQRISSDCISGLPDELLGHILSYLTLRDSVRTSLLSRRWRHLCYRRSVLHFDVVNLLGFPGATRTDLSDQPSKLARAVDRFIQVQTTGLGLNYNVDEVKIHFHFDNVVHTSSRIDGWVRSFVRMGVEDLELMHQFNVIYYYPPYELLSSSLLYCGQTSYLKCLRLRNCRLKLSDGHSTSWISRLTTLDMSHVRLEQEDMECILSSAVNLTLLRLIYCRPPLSPSIIKVELPKLKKLVLSTALDELLLNCPNLEILDFGGSSVQCLKFSDVVPLLRRVNLGWIDIDVSEDYSQNFDALTRHAPNLHALSLTCPGDKVHRILTNAMNCGLKRLDVNLRMNSTGLDMISIDHIMTLCPFLELLHLKLYKGLSESPPSECPDRPHFHLIEVKIVGRTNKGMEKEFARYFLKNAVLLRRLVINDVCLLGEDISC